jgi:hypothetical protein
MSTGKKFGLAFLFVALMGVAAMVLVVMWFSGSTSLVPGSQ